MADETTEQAAAEAKGGTKVLLLAVILVVGLLVGGGVGAFVAAPMLAKPATADGPAAAAEADQAAPEGRERGRRRDGPPVLFAIDNLVLNPANSGGTRFLMVSVAFDLRDARMLDQIRSREPEVRDALLGSFGLRTVDELADIGLRDDVKEDLRKTVDALLEPGAVRDVYLPQFVIQ